jgi:hypothetical protein
MPLNFPDNPQQNDTFTVNGRTYTYRGNKWRRTKARLADVSPTLDVANDFTAGGALHVDSDTGRVGIGTANPQYELHVDGVGEVTGDFQVGQNLDVTGTVDINGLRLTSDGSTISLSEVLAGTYSTQAATTNDDTLATTAFVQSAIANLVDSAPTTLDTLNELAAALGDDPNFATTVTNSIALKLDSSSYTAADVLAKIKTVDGASSGLDADTLDGSHASAFAASSHTHSYAATSHTHSYVPTSGGTVTGNFTVQGNLYVGKDTGGDSNAYFYDDGDNTWRTLQWDDSRNEWRVEDNGGTMRTLYHSGNIPSYAASSHTHSYHVAGGSYGTDFVANKSYADDWFRAKGDTGLYFQDKGTGIRSPLSEGGTYGSVATYGGEGGWEGFSIGGRVVFMHNMSNNWGIYNDVNNEWMIYGALNGDVSLYHNNTVRAQTTSVGLDVNSTIHSNGGQIRTTKNSTGNIGDASLNLGYGNGSGVIMTMNPLNYGPLITVGQGEHFYVRNYLNSAYATWDAVLINRSSVHDKEGIVTLGEIPTSAGSAANPLEAFNAMEKVRELRPVSYFWYEQNALPRMPCNEDGTPNTRRINALKRLNKIRKNKGLGDFTADYLKHLCGRDCEHTPDEPCFRVKNYRNGKIGFIAQEVGELIPAAAHLSEERDEPESIDPVALVAVLTKAVQEMDARIKELESGNA